MCGRFSLTTGLDQLLPHLQGPWPPGLAAHYAPRLEVRPGEPLLLQRQEHGVLQVGLALWGLLPEWAKDPAQARRPINARSETVNEKVSFRGPWRHRRCLVPTPLMQSAGGHVAEPVPSKESTSPMILLPPAALKLPMGLKFPRIFTSVATLPDSTVATRPDVELIEIPPMFQAAIGTCVPRATLRIAPGASETFALVRSAPEAIVVAAPAATVTVPATEPPSVAVPPVTARLPENPPVNCGDAPLPVVTIPVTVLL